MFRNFQASQNPKQFLEFQPTKNVQTINSNINLHEGYSLNPRRQANTIKVAKPAYFRWLKETHKRKRKNRYRNRKRCSYRTRSKHVLLHRTGNKNRSHFQRNKSFSNVELNLNTGYKINLNRSKYIIKNSNSDQRSLQKTGNKKIIPQFIYESELDIRKPSVLTTKKYQNRFIPFPKNNTLSTIINQTTESNTIANKSLFNAHTYAEIYEDVQKFGDKTLGL